MMPDHGIMLQGTSRESTEAEEIGLKTGLAPRKRSLGCMQLQEVDKR